MPTKSDLDAIVLADSERAQLRIAGVTACERAVRVARRVGATSVQVVTRRDELAAWRGDRVLVIRADQLVHTPLVAPLMAVCDGLAIAVTGDDYAGAFLAHGEHARTAVAALARGEDGIAGATQRIPHGEIARHAIATPADRRAAHQLLYRILVKPQDNAITRYVYRPVSFPLTRLLAWTPITPNQISYAVAVLVAVGCWLTAHASDNAAIAGTAVILAASYLDCCDGEIARVKLLSSRYGAWVDTIVDELSTVGYMATLGWHCHLAYGPNYLGNLGFDPWVTAVAIGLVTYGFSMYGIYYNIIVGVGSANSQDYAGKFDVVPGTHPNSVRLRPAPPVEPAREWPRWLEILATYAPYIVRRDFISWAALVLAVLHLTNIMFGIFAAGGLITAVIVAIDHVRLRRLRRSIVARGQVLEAPS